MRAPLRLLTARCVSHSVTIFLQPPSASVRTPPTSARPLHQLTLTFGPRRHFRSPMAAPAASSAAASGSKRAHSGAAAAERRVQPRHFHAGPNPVAIDDDDGAEGGAAVATAVALPPIARLYRDAVGCVFQFLRQGELAAVLQVSSGWLAAVHSMRSLQLKIGSPKVPMFVLAQSAMGRHVESLGVRGARAALTADSLYVLALKMPQLRELMCALPLLPAPAPLPFPAALRKLDLRVSDFDRFADVNVALQSSAA